MLSVVPLTASTPQRWRGEAGGGGRDEAGAPLGEEGSAGHPDTWPKATKGCRPPLSASHRRRAACVGCTHCRAWVSRHLLQRHRGCLGEGEAGCSSCHCRNKVMELVARTVQVVDIGSLKCLGAKVKARAGLAPSGGSRGESISWPLAASRGSRIHLLTAPSSIFQERPCVFL